MKRFLFPLLLICLFGSSVNAAEQPAPQVVVSIKPLYSLVAGLMEGVGQPQLLINGGGSPHGYSLRPSEAVALADAQLIVWVGPGLEGFLEKALATLSPAAVQLELSQRLQPYLLPARSGGTWEKHEHHDEGEHAEQHHDHAEADLDHFDPHIWLSPAMAEKIVALCKDALIAVDPAHQDNYRANAARVIERLRTLDRELRQQLAPVKDTPYIVFHAAYQYFEATYGLNAVGSVTISPDHKPGVKRILAIRDKIKSLHARCVFSEPQFQSNLVKTIIEGTDTRTGVLDPLGADLPANQDTYFVLLHRLADNLYQGLH